jgi:hypothetical protein
MPVQDDERERELVRMFNLVWSPDHQRSGVDAFLDITVNHEKYRLEVEVKSTTGNSVSTARDVGMEHIEKWRKKLFVIGFYTKDAKRPELRKCLCLTPTDMEPWIASIEKKVLLDFKIAEKASKKLDQHDLFQILGEQDSYSMQDAKSLHKQQWTADQYAAASDLKIENKPAFSPRKMLEILSLRSKYIAERGATLNNPHITATHLQPFFGTSREIANSDAAQGIRNLATAFVNESPQHPCVQKLSDLH